MALIEKIETLYSELPHLNCKECGLCCVSPTCTLSEFIYLALYLQNNASEEKLIHYLTAPVQIHPDYPGNVQCIFLESKRCCIHKGRTAACRLFGIPSLANMNIANMEECKNKITVTQGNSSISFVNTWLEKLISLDAEMYDFDVEPYYVMGFNIPCWFDIYFDDSFDFDIFADIRAAMKSHFDLSRFSEYYASKTSLKEKIDKISIVASLIGTGEKGVLLQALNSIKNDYPLTGTYFYEEATEFLRVIDQSD